MAGRTDGLIKSFRAGGAIGPRRFVKFGAADDTVVLATAATDAVIGVTGELGAAQGEQVDVHLTDIAEVVLGGNVTRGVTFVTADANGAAVACNPAAGAQARFGGMALATGAAGDFAPILLQRGVITTPAA